MESSFNQLVGHAGPRFGPRVEFWVIAHVTIQVNATARPGRGVAGRRGASMGAEIRPARAITSGAASGASHPFGMRIAIRRGTDSNPLARVRGDMTASGARGNESDMVECLVAQRHGAGPVHHPSRWMWRNYRSAFEDRFGGAAPRGPLALPAPEFREPRPGPWRRRKSDPGRSPRSRRGPPRPRGPFFERGRPRLAAGRLILEQPTSQVG